MLPEQDDRNLPWLPIVAIEAVINDVRTFCNEQKRVEFESFVAFIKSYFDLVPQNKHNEFTEAVVRVLSEEYTEKMPYLTDVARIEGYLNKAVKDYGRLVIYRDPVTRVRVFSNAVDTKFERAQPQIIDANTRELVEKNNVTERGAYIENTIEEYFSELNTDVFNATDYQHIKMTLRSYFETGISKNEQTFFVKYGNKKKLGYSLGEIYRGLRKESLCIEYLVFCKGLFDCFQKEVIEEGSFFKSRLYKYFTSKTQ